EALDQIEFAQGDIIRAISEMESYFYMGNMLLRDGDTNSMAHSLEVRVPLLDQRLLDLAYAMPGRVRMPDPKQTKTLLRRAFPDLLRPALLQQGKRGFTLPIARWLAGPMREMAEASIDELAGMGILEPAGVRGVWRD